MAYINPVIPGFHPDPSVCRVGEDYYLATSSFNWFPGLPIFHSRDLVNWRKIGHVLDRPEHLPLNDPPGAMFRGIWAPTLRYHHGKFYCVTTNNGFTGNILMQAEDPAGPWSKPIELGHGGWDNSLFFDDDGTCYYSWTEGKDPSVRQVILDPETGEFLGEERGISNGTGSGGTEGSHLYRIGDWYYLLLAEGGTHMGHMLSLLRGRSPWGPFEPSPHGPFLTHRHTEMNQMIKALGHGDLIEDHEGNWWVLALGFRSTGWICFASHVCGRETFLAPVNWREDGWPQVYEGREVQLEMDVPTLPPHPWPGSPEREVFEGDQLGVEWIFRRNPAPQSWSLKETPGRLSLHGPAARLSEPGNLVIGRRQAHLRGEGVARLEFDPARTGEEAGLTAFMDEHYHSALGIRLSADGSHREIFLRRRVGAVLEVEQAVEPVEDGPVELIIRAEPRWYRFGYRQDHDEEIRWLGWAETHLHSTEIAWGWTGVVWGLFAAGNGRPAAAPARFAWFEYRPDPDQSFTPDIPERFELVPPP